MIADEFAGFFFEIGEKEVFMICLDHDLVINSENIHEYSHHVRTSYLEGTQVFPPLVVELKFYPDHNRFRSSLQRSNVEMFFTENRGNAFLIHLCESYFINVSGIVLRGCLEREMTLCLQKLLVEFYYINFDKYIFPLMPVTGLAENHIRELVHKLEHALKDYLATERLVNLDLGLPQVYFRLAKINSNHRDAENYRQALPHSWSRALFLSRKLMEFMPIIILEKYRVKRVQELKSLWLEYNNYLLTEDLHRLEYLAELPAKHESSYTEQVVAMFRYMKFHYLTPRHSRFKQYDFH